MLRERLVVAGLFGIPMLAASAMITWSMDERASAQTTASASRIEPLLGFVEPSDVVDLACSEKGIIEELTIEEGDTVKTGQVICRLESSVENAALEISKTQADSEIGVETARIGHELAEIQLKRVVEIDKRGAAARMELDEALIQEKYSRTQVARAIHDQSVVKHQYERDRIGERNEECSEWEGRVLVVPHRVENQQQDEHGVGEDVEDHHGQQHRFALFGVSGEAALLFFGAGELVQLRARKVEQGPFGQGEKYGRQQTHPGQHQ